MELKDLRPTQTAGILVSDLASRLGAHAVGGDPNARIHGVTMDSLDVQAGDLFVAVGGFNSHGARFASQAIAKGAVAVLSDEAGLAMLGEASVSTLLVADPRAFAGLAAAAVYGEPGKKLRSVGITGTNGKTTTSHFVYHGLTELSGQTLLLGTVGVKLGDVHVTSARTSLEAPVLHRIMAWAVEKGAQNVVMEVSSHALSLHRTSGLKFDVSAFLNLQRDHLDFHQTMLSYFEAKASLFSDKMSRACVVCIDDEWGEKLWKLAAIPTITVSTMRVADWYVKAHALNESDAGTDVVVETKGGQLEMHCPLPGMINVQNQLVALGILTSLGFDANTAGEVLSSTPGVPGRMEVVKERDRSNPLVVVDFAHTADAIESACLALDPVTPGDLWLVFGATGERDKGKRPWMGQAALRFADRVILTDDDIYGEDPAAIRKEVAAGFAGVVARAKSVWESDDRAVAIREAVLVASPGDTVLIAGRGHETIQMVASTARKLDDRVEARRALDQRSSLNLHGVSETSAPKLRLMAKTWEDFQ